MADQNLCADLVIEDVDMAEPYKEMFLAQKRLQIRLASITVDENPVVIANKCIYWHFCISAELKELTDWLKPTAPIMDPMMILKEARMEAIDILHFILNIGIELRYSEDEIESIINSLIKVKPTMVSADLLLSYCILVNHRTIECIEIMPWKSWKTYPDLALSDVRQLLNEEYTKLLGSIFNLCANLGMSNKDVVNFYFAKNKENHVRQDNGY